MTTSGSRLKGNRVWWRKCLARYGPVFCAKAKSDNRHSSPRPDKVLHLFSAALEPGWRTFAFQSEIDRDAFVSMFKAADAQSCEVPIV